MAEFGPQLHSLSWGPLLGGDLSLPASGRPSILQVGNDFRWMVESFGGGGGSEWRDRGLQKGEINHQTTYFSNAIWPYSPNGSRISAEEGSPVSIRVEEESKTCLDLLLTVYTRMTKTQWST